MECTRLSRRENGSAGTWLAAIQSATTLQNTADLEPKVCCLTARFSKSRGNFHTSKIPCVVVVWLFYCLFAQSVQETSSVFALLLVLWCLCVDMCYVFQYPTKITRWRHKYKERRTANTNVTAIDTRSKCSLFNCWANSDPGLLEIK
jgi:hypothetical protein